ncbi:hypothetical protein Pan216_13180 [Planctomycetes bacterium Pan216]|uniref:MetA-pathway of phenol degradation n=1 Tax=Kolteria novifilia TaxID=2527975 RepID=A0A518B0H4_9BACT|nr:hypothetical protein Pan216_13180 [Planctomycetes bacterium Pan216]
MPWTLIGVLLVMGSPVDKDVPPAEQLPTLIAAEPVIEEVSDTQENQKPQSVFYSSLTEREEGGLSSCGSGCCGSGCCGSTCSDCCSCCDPCVPFCEKCRKLFQSDQCFNGFVSPISNPIFARSPISQTELRGMYIYDSIPSQNLAGPGDFNLLACQIRLALTERLQFTADKDGYLWLNSRGLGDPEGWVNLMAGLKYVVIRDVENQFLAAVGCTYELRTGESAIFQGQGDGVFTPYFSVGKEIAEVFHFIGNAGYSVPVDSADNSSFGYFQAHFDAQVTSWLYPVMEFNWWHYTAGGRRGLPTGLQEVDSLINLGTSDMAGRDLVTLAFGLSAKPSKHLEYGIAFEFPLSNNEMWINNRLINQLILRY